MSTAASSHRTVPGSTKLGSRFKPEQVVKIFLAKHFFLLSVGVISVLPSHTVATATSL